MIIRVRPNEWNFLWEKFNMIEDLRMLHCWPTWGHVLWEMTEETILVDIRRRVKLSSVLTRPLKLKITGKILLLSVGLVLTIRFVGLYSISIWAFPEKGQPLLKNEKWSEFCVFLSIIKLKCLYYINIQKNIFFFIYWRKYSTLKREILFYVFFAIYHSFFLNVF